MRFPYGPSATFLRPSLVPNDYSNDPADATEDWTTPIVALHLDHVAVEDYRSEEPTADGRTRITAARRLYIDHIEAIQPTWRVRIGTETDVMRVEGRPEPWTHPRTGTVFGTVVELMWSA